MGSGKIVPAVSYTKIRAHETDKNLERSTKI